MSVLRRCYKVVYWQYDRIEIRHDLWPNLVLPLSIFEQLRWSCWQYDRVEVLNEVWRCMPSPSAIVLGLPLGPVSQILPLASV